jgi:hypothetical protein
LDEQSKWACSAVDHAAMEDTAQMANEGVGCSRGSL